MYRKTYVEINIDNITNNIKSIISNSSFNYYFAVVKGNTYGHGEYIVNDMIESGINYLATSSLEEAIRIRKYNGDIPILCLQPIELEYLEECVKNNITITIHDRNYFDEVNKLDLMLRVHIKVDSGMNRLGLNSKKDMNYVYKKMINNKNLFLEGVYTHLATSGFNDKQYDNQVNRFRELLSDIDLGTIPIVHIDKSATLYLHDKLSFCNGARLGISMYGYRPIPLYPNTIKGIAKKILRLINLKRNKISKTKKVDIKLLPALSLYSNIIQVKNIKKDDYIGYGSSTKAKEDMKIGVIPIGYADGFFRSNKGRYIEINGQKYKLIGDVCMGMISVVIDNNVKVGDKVTLIGDLITAKYVSLYNKTNIYEIVTSISKLVPRVYVKNGDVIYIEE